MRKVVACVSRVTLFIKTYHIQIILVKYVYAVYVQPSGNSSLWEQQSSPDGRTPKLWSCPPTISNPPACLTRLASGGKGAARFFCLPGICLPVFFFFLYRCVSDLNRNIMEMYSYHEEYIIKYICPFMCISVFVYM